ncbi:hypothetical protein ABBQ38_002277 [Trebouxia sp. C0009 RCD-2024]
MLLKSCFSKDLPPQRRSKMTCFSLCISKHIRLRHPILCDARARLCLQSYRLLGRKPIREHLQSAGGSQASPPSTVQVTKAVFASTTKSQLNLNNQRANESNPTLTYPDISFAVENFEEAFESLMLTQPSQCYLVLLIATAGLTFRAKEAVPSSSGEPYKLDPPPLPHDTPATSPSQELATLDTPRSTGSTKQRRLTVFSGFVSYEQLEQKLLGGQRKGLLWLPKNVEGPHPVRMRGPGGLGFADVAVTCLARATPLRQEPEEARGPPLSPNLTWQELQGQSSPAGASPEKPRAGLLGSAFGAAANALKAISNPARSPQAPKQATVYDVRCALMNLSLPVEPLALQLLQ